MASIINKFMNKITNNRYSESDIEFITTNVINNPKYKTCRNYTKLENLISTIKFCNYLDKQLPLLMDILF